MHTAYAALGDRVLVGDSHSGWDDCLLGHDIKCVAAGAAEPERAFAGTADAGLQRTTDGGATWEAVLDAGDRVTSVTVSPHDADVVWAGTEPSAVYRSTDGGATWTERPGLTGLGSSSRWSFPPRPDTHHVRWIALAPDDPKQVYAAIEAGAFVRSPDGGETWIDHPDGARRDNHTLATHPDAPDRVYTAAGDGFALSTDHGETWTHPQDGLAHRYVWGLAVHPDDPDRIVVSAASGPRSAHSTSGESYVYRWDGARWTQSMDGLPGPAGLARPVLAADPDDGFLALTNYGLFQSKHGETWTRRDPGDGDWPAEYDQVPSGLAVV
ncbi:WD40/YVTN/BNR-like repeat-containing protein [Haloarcula japonica]|uniref:WD40/YVTN/BNR-like repeat-containing protein n=1 Tax=Haloarcula japonica TaxID=29282 RepID=UPI0039F73079